MSSHSTNLIVPIYIWSDIPPDHIVNCFDVSGDGSIIATGATDGKICLWNLKLNDGVVEPNLITLSCIDFDAVTAFAFSEYQWSTVLVSVFSNGSIAYWDINDGQCLLSYKSVFKCSPHGIICLYNSKYIISYGASNEIEFLDMSSKKISHRMRLDSWVISSAHIPYEKNEIIFSITRGGSLFIWNIAFPTEDSVETSVLTKIETDMRDLLEVRVSPNWKTLLVVSKKSWKLYYLKDLTLLLTQTENFTISDGRYINDRSILIADTRGFGHVFLFDGVSELIADPLYDIINAAPKKSKITNYLDEISPMFKSTKDVKKKPEIEVIEEVIRYNVSAQHTSTLMSDPDLYTLKSMKYFSIVSNNLIMLMNAIGSIQVYKIKEDLENLPVAVGKFSDGWPEPTLGPKITSSILIQDTLKLARGYEDGTIQISLLPTQINPLIWKAHSKAVTSLLYMNIKGDEFLISGSNDFYVKIWDLNEIIRENGEDIPLLKERFCYHSGTVSELIAPSMSSYKSYNPDWKSRFFSVGADACVVMYQIKNGTPEFMHIYGSHASSIEKVKWIMEQDYLVISCKDQSVNIWDIGEGSLEQTIYGKTASDISNSSKYIEKRSTQDALKRIFKQSITTISTNKSPVEIIMLNVKMISSNLYKKLEKNGDDDLFFDLPEVRVYSYLIPWGLDEHLDHLCLSNLRLQEPDPRISYGLFGMRGRLSIFVPRAKPESRWLTSGTLTSLHSLSLASLTRSIMELRLDALNTCSYVTTFLCSNLIELDDYKKPSFSFLARYWHDGLEDIMESARIIFLTIIKGMTPEGLQKMANKWSMLLQSYDKEENGSYSLAVLVLGILGSETTDTLTPDQSDQVTVEILDLLFSEQSTKLRIAGVELLGKGFATWSPHIQNVGAIIQKLFWLSITKGIQALRSTAHHALMLIGAQDTELFLDTLDDIMNSSDSNPEVHSHALMEIDSLVRKHPGSVINFLPRLVETIVHSLDPNVPHLRDSCLKPATQLVQDMVRKYPLVAFHQATQRLAVGGGINIQIYDLISATRWHILEGHLEAIGAICFSENGNKLCSYSLVDGVVKLWKKSTGLLSGFFGSNFQCTKTESVDPYELEINAELLLESVRILCTKDTFLLIRGWDEDVSIR